MNVTDEFIAGPEKFMGKYVVQVADVTQLNPAKRVDRRDFIFFQITGTTTVALRYAKAEALKVNAYWLPWLDKAAVSMDLGSEADYFFTSQMTNCRFTVLTKDATQPKVAHLAGTLSKTKRNEAEAGLVTAMGGADVVRSRRLSTSGAREHGYTGQTGKPDLDSSAFVYGVRDKESGNWSFEAQIVKAAMTEAFNPKLHGTPEMAAPFKF